MLEQYFYTAEEDFLERIYPWLKGVAEFYRFHLCGEMEDGPDNYEHVIHVAPAWPMEWDVSFELRAKRAFLVAVEVREGKLEPVKITLEKGNRCRIHNPWSGKDVYLWRKNCPGAGRRGGGVFQ